MTIRNMISGFYLGNKYVFFKNKSNSLLVFNLAQLSNINQFELQLNSSDLRMLTIW